MTKAQLEIIKRLRYPHWGLQGGKKDNAEKVPQNRLSDVLEALDATDWDEDASLVILKKLNVYRD